MPYSRSVIVAAARAWLGTPYHHQASLRGVGADCLGLVRGVHRDVTGAEAETPPPYSRDWAEGPGAETLIAAARRNLIEIDPGEASFGDVLVFRYRLHLPAKHCGILVAPGVLIHAIENAAVCEIALSAWWRRRIAGAFAFPGVRD